MSNYLASLLLFVTLAMFSNEISQDTIQQKKQKTIVTEREFKEDLKLKYTDKDFIYEEYEAPKKEINNKPDLSILQNLILVIGKLLPWLLGVFVVYVILKTAFDFDINFWKKQKPNQKLLDNLIYEDDDISEINLEALLNTALQNKDFRLSIRYYYLLILKDLSSKKMIDYHKDKTNAEYLFELKNKEIKTQFTTLSYIYNYVWYGEFPVDEISFKKAELQYKSFLKALI